MSTIHCLQKSVDRIEDILKSISQQLELILTEIQSTQCYVANSNVDAVWTANIKRLWYQYTVGRCAGVLAHCSLRHNYACSYPQLCMLHSPLPPTFRPHIVTLGESSLSSKLSRATSQFLQEPTTPAQRHLYDEALAWAEDVHQTVHSDLDSIHTYMVDSTTPGALSLCSTAFTSKWANNRGSAFPFDDRQLFYPITSFILQKILYQVNGMRILK